MSIWWSLGEGAPPASNSSDVSSRRSRGRRPLSGFFNGSSVVGSNIGDRIQQSSKRIDPSPPQLELPRLDMSHLSPALSPSHRSPTSTRSVIDPAISPPMSTRPLSSVTHRSPVSPLEHEGSDAPSRLTFAHVLDYGGNVPLNQLSPETPRALPRFPSSRSNRRWPSQRNQQHFHAPQRRQPQPQAQPGRTRPQRRARWIPKHARGKTWFAAMESSAVRTKFFRTVVSGSILTITLVTFAVLSTATPSAFTDFRIILILFLLVFGVLFAHSLVRLLMLTHRYKKYGLASVARTERERLPLPLRRQESFVHINEPIHVILARDEEFGLGAGGQDTRGIRRVEVAEEEMNVGTEMEREIGMGMGMEEAKGLTPPPPAYGLWRGSVRVDPNLLHWQRVESNRAAAAAQQRPRSDASVGTVRRPPSYTPPVGHTSSEERGGGYF
ncbi:hypothetical protein MMC10_003397 [Thelotrema lepadinum]|nr:hypothetical protein [Thelotrema lepadinum]